MHTQFKVAPLYVLQILMRWYVYQCTHCYNDVEQQDVKLAGYIALFHLIIT